MERCEGNCDNNNHCGWNVGSGLKCFQRNNKRPIPGCISIRAIGRPSATPPPPPPPPRPPSPSSCSDRRLWLQSRSCAQEARLRFPPCCAPDATGGGARPEPDQDLVQHRHEAQPARGGDPERAPHGPPPRPPACATRPRVGCLREHGSKGVKRPRAVVRMGGGLSGKVALRAPASLSPGNPAPCQCTAQACLAQVLGYLLVAVQPSGGSGWPVQRQQRARMDAAAPAIIGGGGRRLWLQSRSRAKRAGLRFPRCCAPAADAAGGGARPDPDQDPLTVHLVQHRHEAQPARGGDPERAPHGPPPRPPGLCDSASCRLP